MDPLPQETRIDNLRIHSAAKTKVLEVVDAIQTDKKVKPTLSEAVTIMADHYLNTGRASLASAGN